MEIQPQEIVLYLTHTGECPFQEWLESLRDRQARARIRKRLDRLALGNLGDYKTLSASVQEPRISYGPGYRLYFARIGQRIVVLLCGGDKSTQSKDIARAKQYWTDFKKRENADT